MLVKADQQFPADLIVIGTAEQDGSCTIDTANLDGETNLKSKRAPQNLYRRYVRDTQAGTAAGDNIANAAASGMIRKSNTSVNIDEEFPMGKVDEQTIEPNCGALWTASDSLRF